MPPPCWVRRLLQISSNFSACKFAFSEKYEILIILDLVSLSLKLSDLLVKGPFSMTETSSLDCIFLDDVWEEQRHKLGGRSSLFPQCDEFPRSVGRGIGGGLVANICV